MINWSTNEKEFQKKNPREHKLWRLVQLINYGLDEEKLDRNEVKSSWVRIKDRIDPYKARLIEFLLWEKQYSLPTNLSFWNL